MTRVKPKMYAGGRPFVASIPDGGEHQTDPMMPVRKVETLGNRLEQPDRDPIQIMYTHIRQLFGRRNIRGQITMHEREAIIRDVGMMKPIGHEHELLGIERDGNGAVIHLSERTFRQNGQGLLLLSGLRQIIAFKAYDLSLGRQDQGQGQVIRTRIHAEAHGRWVWMDKILKQYAE